MIENKQNIYYNKNVYTNTYLKQKKLQVFLNILLKILEKNKNTKDKN